MLTWSLLFSLAAALNDDVSSSTHIPLKQIVYPSSLRPYQDQSAVHKVKSKKGSLQARGELPDPWNYLTRRASGGNNDKPRSRSWSPGSSPPSSNDRKDSRPPTIIDPPLNTDSPPRATQSQPVDRQVQGSSVPRQPSPPLNLSIFRSDLPLGRQSPPRQELYHNFGYNPSQRVSEEYLAELFPPTNSPPLDLSVFRSDQPANRRPPPRQELYHNTGFDPGQTNSDAHLRGLFPQYAASQPPGARAQNHGYPSTHPPITDRPGVPAFSNDATIAVTTDRTRGSATPARRTIAASSPNSQRLVFSRLSGQRHQILTPYQRSGPPQRQPAEQLQQPSYNPGAYPNQNQIQNTIQSQSGLRSLGRFLDQQIYQSQRQQYNHYSYQSHYPVHDWRQSGGQYQSQAQFRSQNPFQTFEWHVQQSRFQGHLPFDNQNPFQTQHATQHQDLNSWSISRLRSPQSTNRAVAIPQLRDLEAEAQRSAQIPSHRRSQAQGTNRAVTIPQSRDPEAEARRQVQTSPRRQPQVQRTATSQNQNQGRRTSQRQAQNEREARLQELAQAEVQARARAQALARRRTRRAEKRSESDSKAKRQRKD